LLVKFYDYICEIKSIEGFISNNYNNIPHEYYFKYCNDAKIHIPDFINAYDIETIIENSNINTLYTIYKFYNTINIDPLTYIKLTKRIYDHFGGKECFTRFNILNIYDGDDVSYSRVFCILDKQVTHFLVELDMYHPLRNFILIRRLKYLSDREWEDYTNENYSISNAEENMHDTMYDVIDSLS